MKGRIFFIQIRCIRKSESLIFVQKAEIRIGHLFVSIDGGVVNYINRVVQKGEGPILGGNVRWFQNFILRLVLTQDSWVWLHFKQGEFFRLIWTENFQTLKLFGLYWFSKFFWLHFINNIRPIWVEGFKSQNACVQRKKERKNGCKFTSWIHSLAPPGNLASSPLVTHPIAKTFLDIDRGPCLVFLVGHTDFNLVVNVSDLYWLIGIILVSMSGRHPHKFCFEV